jgi:hypothetical protein
MTKSQKATFSSHVVGPLMIVRGLTVGPPRVQSPPPPSPASSSPARQPPPLIRCHRIVVIGLTQP